jgi:ribonuclease E
VGNVYLGRVQNVLPSMEAAFVDVGKGRNAVLYAGEVNWDAAGMEGQPRRIEQALKSGDSVLVQVTKDPIGHKGARLTSQVTLAGRYLVYVPGGAMTGISRKLPDTERARLKKLLKEIVPDDAGVIVRTAAEGASDEELRRDVQRLQEQWAAIEKKSRTASAPALLQGEPDLAIRVVRDIFNDDFRSLVVQGDDVHRMIEEYVSAMAPDLADRVSKYTGTGDVFAEHRVDEQLAKGMDRKVWLPSGGSLVIDRTEAMTVIDVNTGKFTGAGGTLEETVTRNNLEAAEEIVRQLRLRDIGGIIVIDFIDMVLESNRDLVLRRLVECLGRDRTKHQVAEVTSLGLVQMTRKRVGQGLVESFSETCEHCHGRGFVVHSAPVERADGGAESGPEPQGESKRSRRKKNGSGAAGGGGSAATPTVTVPVLPEAREAVKATLATIAAAAAHAHEHEHPHEQASAVVLPELEQLARAVGGRDGAPEPATATDGTGEAALAELADVVGSIRAVEAPAPGSAEDDGTAAGSTGADGGAADGGPEQDHAPADGGPDHDGAPAI